MPGQDDPQPDESQEQWGHHTSLFFFCCTNTSLNKNTSCSMQFSGVELGESPKVSTGSTCTSAQHPGELALGEEWEV